ncbi:ATP-NAD kinase [Xylona heveae TC161]|uniref:ATP-NAD kinase n=1 Tax=Xylona heveae (strain CBS 132557 / TC161) TaxID=1328760 RepID=A0A165GT81_XYLHT|nr:ATP-NAD kinase [Xylona heveae TC161]KZF22568.1 ATP-NAD kinase [Xylona heveae TC161]
MRPIQPRIRLFLSAKRQFSCSHHRREIRSVSELPDRIIPRYQESLHNDLLCLQWPSPPRNVFFIKKENVPAVTDAVIEFSKHVHSSYPSTAMIFENKVASEIHDRLPFPVYTSAADRDTATLELQPKVDLTVTLGGDGTILHAASLFSATNSVPPVLSFSMGTLGFLGEWKYHEYKRAFREVYMSGSGPGDRCAQLTPEKMDESSGAGSVSPEWSSLRGKFMGEARPARVLLRNRLKVGVFDSAGHRINASSDGNLAPKIGGDIHAMNEVIIHRGQDPHLAVVEIFICGRLLTEAVADGIIISTPTGSTAYSLSSGGSIIHPLVPSLLLTPICPRSLSFRPLVVPSSMNITLRISDKNRGRGLELSVDGVRRNHGVDIGTEIHVRGEQLRCRDGVFTSGIPSIVRGTHSTGATGDDGWVGGLNGLLKFNYPFGEA